MFDRISKFHKEFMDKYKDDDDDKQQYYFTTQLLPDYFCIFQGSS